MQIYVGYDEREHDVYEVCRHSILKHSPTSYVYPIQQFAMREAGLYNRPSDNASTEFSLTRFLVPHLHCKKTWSLFIDCDFLITAPIESILNYKDNKYAVMVVKHDYTPRFSTKMDGASQQKYPKKNWSSCILWNCGHPANKGLTLDFINYCHPSCLHRFGWLAEHEIGELPLEYNFLVGEYPKPAKTPTCLHYTNGTPIFKSVRENVELHDYKDLWLKEASECLSKEKILEYQC